MSKTKALKIGIESCRQMHGSIVGDPDFRHEVNPDECTCELGKAIRKLTSLKRLH